MAKKERRATDDLNLALSGISAALSVAQSLDDPAQLKRAIKAADEHVQAAFAALRTIKSLGEKI